MGVFFACQTLGDRHRESQVDTAHPGQGNKYLHEESDIMTAACKPGLIGIVSLSFGELCKIMILQEDCSYMLVVNEQMDIL
jgi:hypothetical protein